MTEPPPVKSLVEILQEKIRADKRNLAEIQRETDIGYFWLRHFKLGHYSNYGIVNLTKLAKFYNVG